MDPNDQPSATARVIRDPLTIVGGQGKDLAKTSAAYAAAGAAHRFVQR